MSSVPIEPPSKLATPLKFLIRRGAPVIFPVLAGLVLASGFIPYQRDDAFIAYRFAANFAASNEIVYNLGGQWIEGFSSPIWFLLLSLSSKIMGPATLPTVSMVMGLASFFAMLLFAIIISKHSKYRAPDHSRWQTFFIVSLLSTLPAACYYSVTGLETLLFATIVLCYAGATARLLPFSIGVASGFCAAWIRPEGPWLMVMGTTQLLFLLNKGERISGLFNKKNIVLLLAPLAGFISLVLIRWYCFGSLLPNTYWAKEPELITGLKYIYKNFTTPWYGFLLLSALVGGLTGGRIYLGFLVAGLTWIFAAVLEGGDWMPLGRMLLSANILFALAAGGLFAHTAGNNAPTKTSLLRKFIAVPLLLLILASNISAIARQTVESRTTMYTLNIDAKDAIKWLQEEEVQSVGLVDIGEIGFRTGINIFDFAGLTDSYIAKAPGGLLDKEFDLDYLFEKRRPQVLIIRLLEPFKNNIIESSDIEIRIMQDDRFIQQYSLAAKILPAYSREPYYGLLIYRRTDL